jgi:hypothetical protein
MKKILVVSAIALVSACSSFWNTQEKKVAEDSKMDGYTVTKEQSEFIVETPYGKKNLYEETSAPRIYSVAASRATNKFLEQTTDIYEKISRPKLYVMQVKKFGIDHIPDGFYYARSKTREIIDGSKTYTVVNTMDEADYFLDIYVSRLKVPDLEGNVLQYKLILLDKESKKIGTWLENIRQVQNDDRSWW